ncbi:Pre-mRNA-splicing factor cwf14 [Colletotrichum fructicola Nara gc5]|uniref:Pre-mRNA-splicing factor cwf14 n=1 Tax=Colletotrichum fructicola (strain Nara gc5) TaxID=1213859 RepID=A0A7J6JJW7_COLFN|nr:Pre-mRNA-splicing factor cwf14 [Colletotrichum fructicola]KAF4491036.1 Pre-mRNA-splicing factor cwf14 [Colletotrichum fructicola Nara gc5]KAF5515067.1 Pre-mRNA-splicing factor cwf14 [Colletotrichum fructicola]
MPPMRHSSKRKPPPEGFSDIEDQLLIFQNKMKDAQNKPPPTGPKHQAQWEIFQIAHTRSRYVYDMYYEKEAISKQLYEWLLKNGYADAMLIAKWKKQGYEKLCCLRCVQTKETNFNSTCVCRVPKAQLKGDQEVQGPVQHGDTHTHHRGGQAFGVIGGLILTTSTRLGVSLFCCKECYAS